MADSGIGIAPEHRTAVFEVFRRLHPAHVHSGTGMGLALVQRIAQRHAGTVELHDSPHGEGIAVHLHLPAQRGVSMTRRAPIEILLVDDDPMDVRLTTEQLAQSKVRNVVNAVGDGREALAYLRGEGEYAGRTRPDVILLAAAAAVTSVGREPDGEPGAAGGTVVE